MPPSHDVHIALSRLRGFISPKKEAERAVRDIRLGLERIVRVLPDIQEWQGVHVAGTNGKGSICAFLSGLFTLAGISYGRFVSPAFPEKHNGVSVNGRHVNPRVYNTESRVVENIYTRALRSWRFASGENPGPLSPFELETATAFRVFDKMRVQYGIVEVGMGGATDATNVMRRKAVTIISKIDLDHQEYLGRTIEEIAKVKAGIMRPGVPCIVDHTNSAEVIKVLRKHARSIGTQISLTWKAEPFLSTLNNELWQLEDYQKQNLLCAALAFRHLFPRKEINLDRLLATDPYLPGRMEWVDIDKLTEGRYKAPVLVDAAHNLNGVQALARHVDAKMRSDNKPITWVMSLSSSKSKPFTEMIETLIRPQDNVAFVEYAQGPNEPQATPAPIGRDIVQSVLTTNDQLYQGTPTINEAIHWAASKAEPGHLIVTGSLYLIRDFYKLDSLHRFREMKTRRPGTSQLWRLSKLWNQQPLTREEFDEFKKARWNLQLGLTGSAMKRIQSGDLQGEEDAQDFDHVESQMSAKRLIEKPAPSSEDDWAAISNETADQEPDVFSEEGEQQIEQPPKDGGRHTILDSAFMELTKLRMAIDHHRRQSKRYRAMEKGILEDIAYESRLDPSSELLAKLHEDQERISQRTNQHKEALEKAVAELDSHPDPIWKESTAKEDVGFAELTKLRAKAKEHQTYYVHYNTALSSLKRDTHSPQPALQTLLEEQASHHRAALDTTLTQIRAHPDAPQKYGLLHEEIFGYRSDKLHTPFRLRTELDPAPEEPEKKEKVQKLKKWEEEEEGDVDFWGRRIEEGEGVVATARSEGREEE